MHASLREFLSALETAGELHRISAEVSPILEISQLVQLQNRAACPTASRFAAAFDPNHWALGGKALLFENVRGCDFPLAINVYGSYRRMEMALGCDESGGFEAIAARIASLTKPQPPRSLSDLIAKARQFLPLLRIPPRMVRFGHCQEAVKLTSNGEVDLTRLPLIKCWPLDGDPRSVGYDISAEQSGTAKGQGRYITFAGMHTIHADDSGDPKPASHNIGMYRAQLIDETHLAMHWHMHHDGAAHWRSWKKIGKPMPIAICLGGEAVMPYAATAPLPPGLSELLMAGFLNGRGIPLVRAKTVPLRVPANSEIVIEGYVSTECGPIGWNPSSGEPLGEGAVFEGPFGDHTGFYSLPDRYPIMTVTAITHRRDAVFPAIVVGPPPQEDYYLGKATERIFLPLLKTLIHDIDDYHLPLFGCFHNCAFIRIRKAYPLHARRVMHAIWGAGQMSWTKLIVVVDEEVNVHDENAVWEAVFANTHFGRDLETVHGPLDILDHAAPFLGAGTKLGIDATRKIPGEELQSIPIEKGPPKPTAYSPWVSSSTIFPDFGKGRCAFISVNKRKAGDGLRAINDLWSRIPAGAGVADFTIAVNEGIDLNDSSAVLFHALANADPGRDLHRRDHRVAIDATAKLPGDEQQGLPVRPFPPVLGMTPEIIETVSDRWVEYGLRH